MKPRQHIDCRGFMAHGFLQAAIPVGRNCRSPFPSKARHTGRCSRTGRCCSQCRRHSRIGSAGSGYRAGSRSAAARSCTSIGTSIGPSPDRRRRDWTRRDRDSCMSPRLPACRRRLGTRRWYRGSPFRMTCHPVCWGSSTGPLPGCRRPDRGIDRASGRSPDCPRRTRRPGRCRSWCRRRRRCRQRRSASWGSCRHGWPGRRPRPRGTGRSPYRPQCIRRRSRSGALHTGYRRSHNGTR